MKRPQRCAMAAAIAFLVLCVLLGVSSFCAVNSVHDTWRAVDYWLAWYSGIALLGSAICAINFGINIYLSLDCEP